MNPKNKKQNFEVAIHAKKSEGRNDRNDPLGASVLCPGFQRTVFSSNKSSQ